MSVSWDYVLKYILVGDAGVGKVIYFPQSCGHRATGSRSSLLVRLTDRRFLTNPDPTLGVEFGSKLIRIEDGNKTIKLQCWDTAGTEAFRSITRSYYRGAAGALLVFDVTSRPSFVNARTWLEDIRAHADPHLTCVLIANKIDLCDEEGDTVSETSKRQVTHEEAELWAEQEGLLFLEASAKNGTNVDEAFDQAARDILKKIQNGVFDDKTSHGIKTARPANDPSQMTLEGTSRPPKGACC